MGRDGYQEPPFFGKEQFVQPCESPMVRRMYSSFIYICNGEIASYLHPGAAKRPFFIEQQAEEQGTAVDDDGGCSDIP